MNNNNELNITIERTAKLLTEKKVTSRGSVNGWRFLYRQLDEQTGAKMCSYELH